MYEENKRFNFTNFFIKGIIIVIFVLFTAWLLSLSNKETSNSLDVLTDQIFSENIDRMKEVGKEYFTTERLPKNIGDIETLTLEEMYKKHLILEVKDKNGNACDAEDSYVSIEKLENEYQMKVNLECGEEEEFILVIMGCYDYCDTDICEVKVEEDKKVEYEYKKTTGGEWTDYGNWSEWSKISVTNNNYRQVETKKEKENYSYYKDIVEKINVDFSQKCPSGYTKDGNTCYKNYTVKDEKTPVCEAISGYTVTQNGLTCTYKKTTTSTNNPTCPAKTGYTVTQSGLTCTYKKTTTSTNNPTCPAKTGYTVTQSGLTCTYKKTTTSTNNPTCPATSDGYSLVSQSGLTCKYSKKVKSSDYDLEFVKQTNGSYMPSDTSTYHYKKVSVQDVLSCDNTCTKKTIYTYNVYKKVYGTTTVSKSTTLTCPSGYTKSGSNCVKTTTDTKTETLACPTGYTKSGNDCVKKTTSTKTETLTCPSGYTKSGNDCVKKTTSTKTETLTCPSGYKSNGSSCIKETVKKKYADLINYCGNGTKERQDGKGCYKEETSKIKVEGTREVTYYRYRTRQYIGGTVDYKWSSSKNDKKLLDAGYVLTGRTR